MTERVNEAGLNVDSGAKPEHGVAYTDRGTATCYCGKFSWTGATDIERHAAEFLTTPAPTGPGEGR